MATPRRGLTAVANRVVPDPAAEPSEPAVPPTTQPWPDRGLPLRVLDLLSEKLDPRLIARRKGPNGRMVRYLEGYQAINQANKLFGYDNWGAELIGQIDYRELHHSTTKSGDIATRGLYTATVRVPRSRLSAEVGHRLRLHGRRDRRIARNGGQGCRHGWPQAHASTVLC